LRKFKLGLIISTHARHSGITLVIVNGSHKPLERQLTDKQLKTVLYIRQ